MTRRWRFQKLDNKKTAALKRGNERDNNLEHKKPPQKRGGYLIVFIL